MKTHIHDATPGAHPIPETSNLETLDNWSKLQARNQTQAQLEYAICLLSGSGVATDEAKGFQCLQQSALQGVMVAVFQV